VGVRYAGLLLTAVVAGAVAALVSARYFSSDNMQRAIPALVVAAVTVTVVLAVGAALIARQDSPENLAKFLLWVVFILAAVPGLAWFGLWISDFDPQALYGVAAVAIGGLPVLMSYLRPTAVPLTLGFCLLAAIATLVLWRQLFLFLPVSVAVTGGWLLALTLLGSARRRRAKTVVPSN